MQYDSNTRQHQKTLLHPGKMKTTQCNTLPHNYN